MFFRDADSGGSGGAGAAGSGVGGAGVAGSGVAFARQPATLAVVAAATVLTLALGIAPQPPLDLAKAASTFAW